MIERLRVTIEPEYPDMAGERTIVVEVLRSGQKELGYRKVLRCNEFERFFDQIWEEARRNIVNYSGLEENSNANKALTSPADLP